MTPMEKAARALVAFDGGAWESAAQSYRTGQAEAAVTAYLEAIAEDKETVERVAKSQYAKGCELGRLEGGSPTPWDDMPDGSREAILAVTIVALRALTGTGR